MLERPKRVSCWNIRQESNSSYCRHSGCCCITLVNCGIPFPSPFLPPLLLQLQLKLALFLLFHLWQLTYGKVTFRSDQASTNVALKLESGRRGNNELRTLSNCRHANQAESQQFQAEIRRRRRRPLLHKLVVEYSKECSNTSFPLGR